MRMAGMRMVGFGGRRGIYGRDSVVAPELPEKPASWPDDSNKVENVSASSPNGVFSVNLHKRRLRRKATDNEIKRTVETNPIFDGHPSHPNYAKCNPSIMLPATSVYTLGVLGPMLLPDKVFSGDFITSYTEGAVLENERSTCVTFARQTYWLWTIFARTYLVMGYAITLQTFTLKQLSDAVFTATRCGADTFWSLKIACNSVYTGYVLANIWQTMDMLKWIRHAPDRTYVRDKTHVTDESPSTTTYKIKEAKRCEVDGRPMIASTLELRRTKEDDNKIDPNWGVPFSYKVFVFVVVLAPRFILAGSLWFIGTAFIVLSEDNSTLITNTLAVGFVLDIDTIVFAFTTSNAMQDCLSSLPGVQLRPLSQIRKAYLKAHLPFEALHRRSSKVAPAALKTSKGASAWATKTFDRSNASIELLSAYGVYKVTMLSIVTLLAWGSEMYLCQYIFLVNATFQNGTTVNDDTASV